MEDSTESNIGIDLCIFSIDYYLSYDYCLRIKSLKLNTVSITICLQNVERKNKTKLVS